MGAPIKVAGDAGSRVVGQDRVRSGFALSLSRGCEDALVVGAHAIECGVIGRPADAGWPRGTARRAHMPGAQCRLTGAKEIAIDSNPAWLTAGAGGVRRCDYTGRARRSDINFV